MFYFLKNNRKYYKKNTNKGDIANKIKRGKNTEIEKVKLTKLCVFLCVSGRVGKEDERTAVVELLTNQRNPIVTPSLVLDPTTIRKVHIPPLTRCTQPQHLKFHYYFPFFIFTLTMFAASHLSLSLPFTY